MIDSENLKEKNGKKNYIFLLVLILILAFILRYYKANAVNIWVDDAFSYFLSLESVSRILKTLYYTDAHPPLSYFFFHFWVKLGQNLLFLRFPGILMGTLSIIGVYLLGKELISEKAGIIAAFMTAVSAAHIFMCWQIRMYPYLSFFIIFAFYFFTKLFARGRASELRFDGTNRNSETCPLSESASGGLAHKHSSNEQRATSNGIYWLLYTLFMVISWYLHYFAIFITIAHNIIVILFYRRINIKYWIYSQLAIVICYLPWFKYLFFQLFTNRGPQETAFSWHFILMVYMFFTTHIIYIPGKYYYYFSVPMCSLLVLLSVMAVINNRKDRFMLAVVFIGFYAQFFMLYFKSLLTAQSVFQERYFQYILPLYFLTIIASFVNKEKIKTFLATIVILCFLIFNASALYNMYYVKSFGIQRWTEATDYIKKDYRNTDGIIIQSSYQAFPFNYYFTNCHKEYYVPGRDTKKLKYILKNHKRVWMIMSFAWQDDPNNDATKWLAANCKTIQTIRFKSFLENESADIIIWLFERKPEIKH